GRLQGHPPELRDRHGCAAGEDRPAPEAPGALLRGVPDAQQQAEPQRNPHARVMRSGQWLATSVRGAPLTVAAVPLRISCTESPRSLVPSGRKRKTPSAPMKPAGFVSILAAKPCPPCARASATASVTAS